MRCGLQSRDAGCSREMQVAGCEMQIAGREMWVTSCEMWFTGSDLKVAGREMQVVIAKCRRIGEFSGVRLWRIHGVPLLLLCLKWY